MRNGTGLACQRVEEKYVQRTQRGHQIDTSCCLYFIESYVRYPTLCIRVNVLPMSLIPMKKLKTELELVQGAYDGLEPTLLRNSLTWSVILKTVEVYGVTKVASMVAPL